MNLLNTSKDQLTEAVSQLSATWGVTKEVWRDNTRQDFESNFWSEFEVATVAAVQKLQELSDSIDQAEREMP
ncbi:MAG: hypothetical protein KGL39_57605 [Patescibacteria group bacterium]|nr:hypothetical protein [Patescibacteria group bacterium]